MKIMDGVTANGDSELFYHNGGNNKLNVYVFNNLGGGTITIQAQTPDGLSWVSLQGEVIDSEGLFVIDAAPFIGKAVLSDATGADVDVWVESDNARTKNRVNKGA